MESGSEWNQTARAVWPDPAGTIHYDPNVEEAGCCCGPQTGCFACRVAIDHRINTNLVRKMECTRKARNSTPHEMG